MESALISQSLKKFYRIVIKEYKSAYDNASRLIYSPILYDLTPILNNQAEEYTDLRSFYSKVIGNQYYAILEDIREWSNPTNEREIEINLKPITYQDL